MIAAEEGDLLALQDAIKQEKDAINLRNDIGYAPLAHSAKHGHIEIAQHLIGAGAEIDAVTNANQTALFIACWANQLQVARLLI